MNFRKKSPVNKLYKIAFNPKKSSNKLNYFSTSVWRILFLVKLNPIYYSREKKIFDKSSRIPPAFRGYNVLIHSGRKYSSKTPNRWLIGYRFGNFTWNRVIAKYKAKQSKKKKKN